MPEFDTAHVKNIVLLGHAGTGKTTLAECMLFEAGIINRRGTVGDRTTTGDYHELEQERGNSIFSKLLHTRWRGYKINIIDTPGYDDFVGEVISALRVADTGVMLLNAVMGVEVTTDIIWDYTERFKTPMIFAINKLDDDQADFDRTLREARSHFGNNVVLVQYPRQTGAGFHEIIDVLRMTMYKFRDRGGKPEKLPIPEDERERADRLHKELIEAIASNDESLMERYFEKGELKKVNGHAFDHPSEAIQWLQTIAGPYGIGRDIHVGDTIIGIKGRVGFEAAAPMVILKAHHALEKHVLSKWQLQWKDQLAQFYGNWLHEGQILDPVMRDMEAYLESSQRNVTGKVFIQLHPYRYQVIGIESEFDLMNSAFGSYGEMNAGFTGDDVKGFTRIFGNQTAIYHLVKESVNQKNASEF